MLYNQDWEQPIPWTLSSLIAWLETKDPNEYYDYGDPSNCLNTQYAKSLGYKGVSASACHVYSKRSGWLSWLSPISTMRLPMYFNEIARASSTFGGALTGAKAVQRSIYVQGLRFQDRPVASSESLENIV